MWTFCKNQIKAAKVYKVSILNIMFTVFGRFSPRASKCLHNKRGFYHQKRCISCISISLMPALGRKKFKNL